jgi:hypothetical protein
MADLANIAVSLSHFETALSAFVKEPGNFINMLILTLEKVVI